jgi:hypothetical protein
MAFVAKRNNSFGAVTTRGKKKVNNILKECTTEPVIIIEASDP